jgi:HAD superfamily hydrolase (TIGR01509 family)
MNLDHQRFWIFDMDGTLTVAAHDFDAIRKTLGLVPGQPILEQLAKLPEARAAPLRRRLDEIEFDIARQAQPQAGARDLLTYLGERGTTFGILTRNSHSNALETLSVCGLGGFFDSRYILGREACDPKPSPAGIRRLLREWGARPGQTVMVGDFRFDLESGREAGTAAVYVDPSGKFEWSELADVSVRDLHELLDLLKSQRRDDG